jgi:hypothetical protein
MEPFVRELAGGFGGSGGIPHLSNRPALDVSWKQNRGFGLPCVGCRATCQDCGEALMGLFPKPTDKMTFVLSKTWTRLSIPEKLPCAQNNFQNSIILLFYIGVNSSRFKKSRRSPTRLKVLYVHRLDQGTSFDNVETFIQKVGFGSTVSPTQN